MALILQEFRLPKDICLMIEKINYKKDFKLVFEELIDKVEIEEKYKIHEFYFLQILPFIKKIIILRPTFNDNLVLKIFYCHIYNQYNSHYILYKDHMNDFIYQKKKYNIYYNPI